MAEQPGEHKCAMEQESFLGTVQLLAALGGSANKPNVFLVIHQQM